MKNTLLHIMLIFGAITVMTTSCTEIIDVDLNSSEPQIVIEGNITTDGEPTVIKITESVNFDESINFTNVEDAIVTLSDGMGNLEVLVAESPGAYTTNTLTGIIGNIYTLTVEVQGKILTSQSSMPNQVDFEDLVIEESTDTGGFGGGNDDSSTSYDIFVSYTDPISEKNYYRFVVYINGEYEESLVFDDRLSDGLSVTNNLRIESGLDIGDTVLVIMQCVDQDVYEYFHSFGNLIGGPQNSSTPANPITNIEGSDLGYFSAHTTEERIIIIL